MRGALHLLVILGAFYAGTLAAAPRSGSESTAGLPPADLSRVEASASVPGLIGAPVASKPPLLSTQRSRVSRSDGAPRPRPTQRKTRDDASSSTAPRIAPSVPPARNTATTPARPSVAAAQKLSGYASWYGTGGPGLYAALPGYVDGTHVQVAVCAFPGGHATCVTVPVVTQCGCPGSAIVDLSPPAFRALGVPLSVGLVKVTVEVLR